MAYVVAVTRMHRAAGVFACAFAYGAAHLFGWPGTLLIGAAGALASVALFVCTAMIYACLRFLQEWAAR